jgi:hypothetical protein
MNSYTCLPSYQQRSAHESAEIGMGLVNGAAISIVFWAVLVFMFCLLG